MTPYFLLEISISLVNDRVHVQELIKLDSRIHFLPCADEEIKPFKSEKEHGRKRGDFLPFPSILESSGFRLVFIAASQFLRTHEVDQTLFHRFYILYF